MKVALSLSPASLKPVRGLLIGLFALGAALAAGGPSFAQATPDYAAIVAAPDRSDADHLLDARRKPALTLAFVGARPGMKVLDIAAVNGYKAELLARAVAPNGVVYAQNSSPLYDHVKEQLIPRLMTPAAKNIVSDVRNFEDPVPPGVHDLDLVTFFYFYHDTTYSHVDRPQMLRAIYAGLKPGGIFVVADYSAKPGAGTSVAKTLHRMDEALARSEIEAAGFKLIDEAKFLRDPDDPREEPTFHPSVPADVFMLKYQKPQ
jgi:predicted methyltransferase